MVPRTPRRVLTNPMPRPPWRSPTGQNVRAPAPPASQHRRTNRTDAFIFIPCTTGPEEASPEDDSLACKVSIFPPFCYLSLCAIPLPHSTSLSPRARPVSVVFFDSGFPIFSSWIYLDAPSVPHPLTHEPRKLQARSAAPYRSRDTDPRHVSPGSLCPCRIMVPNHDSHSASTAYLPCFTLT